jgi:hypothetical protein
LGNSKKAESFYAFGFFDHICHRQLSIQEGRVHRNEEHSFILLVILATLTICTDGKHETMRQRLQAQNACTKLHITMP